MRGLTPRVFEDLFARIEELKANVEVRLTRHTCIRPTCQVADAVLTILREPCCGFYFSKEPCRQCSRLVKTLSAS